MNGIHRRLESLQRTADRRSRIKPRLALVQNVSFLVLFWVYGALFVLLIAPPFSYLDPILRYVGLDPNDRSGSLSIEFLVVLLGFLAASAVPGVLICWFGRWLFVRIGLMTQRESHDYLPLDELPDSWLEESSATETAMTRNAKTIGRIFAASAFVFPLLLTAWIRYARK